MAASPYRVEVLPSAAEAKRCITAGAGRTVAACGAEAEFFLRGFDAYGNAAAIHPEQLDLKAILSNSTLQVRLEPVALKQRRTAFMYLAIAHTNLFHIIR